MTDRPGFEFLRLTRSVYSMAYDIAYKSNYKILGPIGDRPWLPPPERGDDAYRRQGKQNR